MTIRKNALFSLDLSSVRNQETSRVTSESVKIILDYSRTTTTRLTATIMSA